MGWLCSQCGSENPTFSVVCGVCGKAEGPIERFRDACRAAVEFTEEILPFVKLDAFRKYWCYLSRALFGILLFLSLFVILRGGTVEGLHTAVPRLKAQTKDLSAQWEWFHAGERIETLEKRFGESAVSPSERWKAQLQKGNDLMMIFLPEDRSAAPADGSTKETDAFRSGSFAVNWETVRSRILKQFGKIRVYLRKEKQRT